MAEIIQEDLEELKEAMDYADSSKDPNAYLDVAIKAKDVADLIFEQHDGISDEFIRYKNLSADYYMKVAKTMKFPQAYLMAAIVYLHANNEKKAHKAVDKLVKRKRSDMIDPVVADIVVEILDGDYEKVKNDFIKGKFAVDENIRPDLENLFRYQDAFRSKK